MKQLQPVVWTKGTFLTPQHMQAQSRFLEDSLQFELQALNYRAWGFSELTFDQQALAEGNVAITRACGIFPDGVLFDIPDSDPAPPRRSVVECFAPEQKSLDVFLALPGYRDNSVNVSRGQRDGNARFLAEIALMRDENTGGPERPVQVARKNMRLLAENESREGDVVLRIARLERTGAGAFRLDPRFVPPLLNIAGDEYLKRIARSLVETLSAKISILSGSRRQKNQSLADFSVSDIANFWLLYTMNSHFPRLRSYSEGEPAHAEALYQSMLSLAGALTTFSMTIQPRDLPEYNHDALGDCFTQLDEKLRLLLRTIVPSNFVSLPLKLARPSIYSTDIPDDKYLDNTRLYLAINAQNTAADLITRVPQLVKVCSASHIEQLVRQALPGITLTHVSSPPSSIPVKLQYQYFSINQSGPAWDAVKRGRNLAVYVPADIREPQLEAVILLPAAVPQAA